MDTDKLMWLPLCCNPDDKLRFIQDHYGLSGYAIIIRLFQAIGATHGWYIEWSDNTAERFAADVGAKSTFVGEIINAATHRGIFDLRLYLKHKVLTSREIQQIHFALVHSLDTNESQKAYLLQSAPFSTAETSGLTEKSQRVSERSENTEFASGEHAKFPKQYKDSNVTSTISRTVEVEDSNNRCKDNNLLTNNTLYSLNKIFSCLFTPCIPQKSGADCKAKRQGVSAERQHAPPEQAPALDRKNTGEKGKKKAAVVTDEEAERIFRDYAQSAKELELLTAWFDNRKAARANNTAYAIKLNLNKLDTYAKESKLNRTEYLEQIVMRGWQAFYPMHTHGSAKAEVQRKSHVSEMDELLANQARRALAKTKGDLQ